MKGILRSFKYRLSRRVLSMVRWAELDEIQRDTEELRTRLAECGSDVHFYPPFKVLGHEMIRVGDNVHVAHNSYIQGSGGLEIGSNTHISRNVVIYTTNHNYEGQWLPYDEEVIRKPVRIGRNVWIGMNVCIAPGTTIGEGAIVAMGTTVSGDVPPRAIIGSSKWRQISQRDETKYAELDALGCWGGVNGRRWTGE